MSLDLHKVGHFVAVAEELNFTRAAERLHMTQQALSTSIRQFERELGVTLLQRSTRHVELTDAGRALLNDGRSLLAASEMARERVRATGRGEIGELRLGHTPAVTGEEIRELARTVRARQPGISVSAQQVFPPALADRLLGGTLDVGLGRVLAAHPGLAVATIGQQPLRAAVAADHPLADRAVVPTADLADSTIVIWGRPGRSGYADLLVDLCRRAGFEPRLEVDPVQGTPPVTAVAGTSHVAFVTAPPGPTADGRVVVLELRPEPFVPLQAMTVEQPAAPMVAEFLAAVS